MGMGAEQSLTRRPFPLTSQKPCPLAVPSAIMTLFRNPIGQRGYRNPHKATGREWTVENFGTGTRCFWI
jgi:hypothetical protein